MKNITKRGVGAPKKAHEKLMKPVALRLDDSDKAIYNAMGSGKWVRAMIKNIPPGQIALVERRNGGQPSILNKII